MCLDGQPLKSTKTFGKGAMVQDINFGKGAKCLVFTKPFGKGVMATFPAIRPPVTIFVIRTDLPN